MKNINIPNYIRVDEYKILNSITKYDDTEEFTVPYYLIDKMINYFNDIKEIFKIYPKFDMYIFSKAFSYNFYLEACNFNTLEVDYDDICLSSIAYNIINYLRNSWDIEKEDLKKYLIFIIKIEIIEKQDLLKIIFIIIMNINLKKLLKKRMMI